MKINYLIKSLIFMAITTQETLSKESLAKALLIIMPANSPHNSDIFISSVISLIFFSFKTILIHSNIPHYLKHQKFHHIPKQLN